MKKYEIQFKLKGKKYELQNPVRKVTVDGISEVHAISVVNSEYNNAKLTKLELLNVREVRNEKL